MIYCKLTICFRCRYQHRNIYIGIYMIFWVFNGDFFNVFDVKWSKKEIFDIGKKGTLEFEYFYIVKEQELKNSPFWAIAAAESIFWGSQGDFLAHGRDKWCKMIKKGDIRNRTERYVSSWITLYCKKREIEKLTFLTI